MGGLFSLLKNAGSDVLTVLLSLSTWWDGSEHFLVAERWKWILESDAVSRQDVFGTLFFSVRGERLRMR